MSFDPTITTIQNAMDHSMLRLNTIAQNIARSSVPGYMARSVVSDVHGAHTVITKKPVALDEQLTRNVQEEMQFRALLHGLDYKLSILHSALDNGR